MAFLPQPQEEVGADEDTNIDVHTTNGTPIRYLPLDHLYSATSPCRVNPSGSSNVMSKKVKARKFSLTHLDDSDQKKQLIKPPLVYVYSRRRKRPRFSEKGLSVYDSLVAREELNLGIQGIGGSDKEFEDGNSEAGRLLNRMRGGNSELEKLGADLDALGGCSTDRTRLRNCRNHDLNIRSISSARKRKVISSEDSQKPLPATYNVKRWVRLNYDNADPKTFIGLKCKVYWPLDIDWYSGCVESYDEETKLHHVKYQDGDEEDIVLSKEKIKFHVSIEDMQRLNLSGRVKGLDDDVSDADELLVLAASLDDSQDFEPDDIIWAKLTGHAMWPAVVVDESCISNSKGLKTISGGRWVFVQFFGTHDFARVRVPPAVSFLKGLIDSYHSKCNKPSFIRGLKEAKMYLSARKLHPNMVRMRKKFNADDCEDPSGEDEGCTNSDEECFNDKGTLTTVESVENSPYVIGDLQIISFGKIVKDSGYFWDGRSICPEGYTAMRKFTSIADPKECALYKMEVLRDAESKIRPLFRVTLDSGEQFNGSSPSACWNKIYKRIKRVEKGSANGSVVEVGQGREYKSGSDMFGFSNSEVVKMIKRLSKSGVSSKSLICKLSSGRNDNLPLGYRHIRIDWHDLDKCSVCYMDEEYENNLFLQCDKCRMMVHARCYGELESVNDELWLCNLCRPGAPDPPPPCCLCPLIGGAMKPTTNGKWAHLACAMWIPETCLADVKKMEPIDGLSRINKDRWKLSCSICGIPYGACIQCSNNSCRVAYHPLCARAAGLCVELEDEDRLYLLSVDEEEDQCIRLLSFCKKHRQPSNEHPVADERVRHVVHQCLDYKPPSNPSGCARCEPYNYFGRRGRKEPEALAAASLKRLFVENQSHLVGGYCQHGLSNYMESSGRGVCSKFFINQHRLRMSLLNGSNGILSAAEKYQDMRETFRKRLAFGKSRIHGFGIFAKYPYKGGDMVIEYSGELVRPSIADRREHFIYNSLVGAGTYMFRIDDERVIDATRAGSIAHLINHSCEPNCYSRVISVNGDEHIIIFAKRDIKQWEELTYDYRFFSIDEQLACYCGFPRCRGVVNDTEAEERSARLYAPRSELIDWRGE